jgi:hypothetical protein
MLHESRVENQEEERTWFFGKGHQPVRSGHDGSFHDGSFHDFLFGYGLDCRFSYDLEISNEWTKGKPSDARSSILCVLGPG